MSLAFHACGSAAKAFASAQPEEPCQRLFCHAAWVVAVGLVEAAAPRAVVGLVEAAATRENESERERAQL